MMKMGNDKNITEGKNGKIYYGKGTKGGMATQPTTPNTNINSVKISSKTDTKEKNAAKAQLAELEAKVAKAHTKNVVDMGMAGLGVHIAKSRVWFINQCLTKQSFVAQGYITGLVFQNKTYDDYLDFLEDTVNRYKERVKVENKRGENIWRKELDLGEYKKAKKRLALGREIRETGPTHPKVAIAFEKLKKAENTKREVSLYDAAVRELSLFKTKNADLLN